MHNTTSAVANERRSEQRGATVFRPVLIETEDFAGFCLVRNLSPQGMQGKVYTTFAATQPISILFSDDAVVRGQLVWCEGEHIGVRFDKAIVVPDMLAHLARKQIDGRPTRPLRLAVHSDAELLIEGRRIDAEIQDISQKGVKVRTSYVRPGEEILVELRAMAPRKAIVRWSQAGMAGLNFLRPLSFDELAQWVVGQQMGGQWAGGQVQLGDHGAAIPALALKRQRRTGQMA
jgi:hypothetical protein